MAQVSSGAMPLPIAGEIRFHRFQMQFRSRIRPALAAKVNVLADRGVVSALYRVQCHNREDLTGQLKEITPIPSLVVFVKTDANICWDRISTSRTANRVETGFKRCPPERRREAFIESHTEYHSFCIKTLQDLPHAVVDGHQDRNSLIDQVLNIVEPYLIEPPPARFGNDGDTYHWLRGLTRRDRDCMRREPEKVLSLVTAEQPSIRLEALAAATRLKLRVDEDILRKLVKDADRDVRLAAGALIANGSRNAICDIVEELSLRPGQKLSDFVQQLQASGNPAAMEIAAEIAHRFPFVLAAVAIGAKFQRSMPLETIAAILACDIARPAFVRNLADQALVLPSFVELEAACRFATGDDDFGSMVALQAKSAERNSLGLLERKELLFSGDAKVVEAAVNAFVFTGLHEHIPTCFKQHSNVDVRIRLALEKLSEPLKS